MLKEFFVCIEQLDLAAEQLRRCDPSYARFGLMLVDNVVELMLHNQCEIAILLDERPLWGEERKYDRDTRERVLGQHFDEKCKFCLRIDKISQDESEFIAICHKYRNELYHSGLKYDDIIFSVARHYFEVAYGLLRKFRPMFYSWGSQDSVSEVVQRHIGGDIQRLAFQPGVLESNAANSLIAALPTLAEPLWETLAQAADARIDDVLRDLEFLARGSDHAKSLGLCLFVIKRGPYWRLEPRFRLPKHRRTGRSGPAR